MAGARQRLLVNRCFLRNEPGDLSFFLFFGIEKRLSFRKINIDQFSVYLKSEFSKYL